MDQQFDFRALLIKLQDCLSDNDRRRLHFIVGDTIPRYLRDDPTLGGTLSLLESLFDRAIISEQDFDYLIQAFNEIHCYQGVKRLQEYQMTRQGSNRRETILSDIIEDNENDRITITKGFPNSIPMNSSKPNESNQDSFMSLNKQGIDTNNLPIQINSMKSEKKIVNVNLTFIKQTLKSRLTACQLILLILNILGILTIVIVTVILRKQPCSTNETDFEDILIIKQGLFYGEPLDGAAFNDAVTNSLTLTDKLIGVNASWAYDTLTSIMFIYSNGGASQHGTGDAIRYPIGWSMFNLTAEESFTGVTMYIDLRDIINPYRSNGTIIIVGLQFSTSTSRQSQLFGSSNGTKYTEVFSNYALAYVQGRSYAFIDALQFTWTREYEASKTSMIANV